MTKTWEDIRREHFDRARADLANVFGVEAFGPNRHGHLVVSETSAVVLRSMATVKDPSMVGSQVFGIPLEIAPDWTCDPARTAAARDRALIRRNVKAIRAGFRELWEA